MYFSISLSDKSIGFIWLMGENEKDKALKSRQIEGILGETTFVTD